MNKDKFDAPTQEKIGEAEALTAMFESSGWAVAEKQYDALIAQLKDISTLQGEIEKGGDITQLARDRINTVAVMEEWMNTLKSKINNVTMMSNTTQSSVLVTRRD